MFHLYFFHALPRASQQRARRRSRQADFISCANASADFRCSEIHAGFLICCRYSGCFKNCSSRRQNRLPLYTAYVLHRQTVPASALPSGSGPHGCGPSDLCAGSVPTVPVYLFRLNKGKTGVKQSIKAGAGSRFPRLQLRGPADNSTAQAMGAALFLGIRAKLLS